MSANVATFPMKSESPARRSLIQRVGRCTLSRRLRKAPSLYSGCMPWTSRREQKSSVGPSSLRPAYLERASIPREEKRHLTHCGKTNVPLSCLATVLSTSHLAPMETSPHGTAGCSAITRPHYNRCWLTTTHLTGVLVEGVSGRRAAALLPTAAET